MLKLHSKFGENENSDEFVSQTEFTSESKVGVGNAGINCIGIPEGKS